MCGIAGLHTPGKEAVPSLDLLRSMTRAIAHRGPDDEGTFLRPSVGLGHRRLAIIDVGSGQQPMLSADSGTAIVYNGEIYNFRALRSELEALGHSFRTGSDTEVILAAYAAWGEGCAARLRGMFAFAIWDGPRERIYLARDRIGIKPLYYAWDCGTLRFGSEIKAILADPTVGRELDLLALDEYLSYLYVPAPRSIFRRIRKLRPGHWMTVSREGLVEREYWDLAFAPDRDRTLGDWTRGVRRALEESVEAHLMSEVPLGAFLSGGIDSTAVVGVMAGLIDGPVQTASIGFQDGAYDELPYARAAARAFHTDAYEKVVAPSAAAILDRLVWHFDEPFADSSMVPTYYVSQVARERVTVALSGDGGDENFAGYRRYRFDALENRLRSRVPAWFRRSVVASAARAYPKADWLPRPLRGKTLLTNLAASPERAYYHTMTWFTPALKRSLYLPWLSDAVSDHDAFDVMGAHFARCRGLDPLSRIQYVDFKTYLPDDILAKVDRASMAHSLEVRVPLLDHRFVEYAATIPPEWKLRGGAGKYIFKESLRGLVPDPILDRRKMGFSVPLAEWFRGELRPAFEGSVLAEDGFVSRYFRLPTIRRWWGQHQRGTTDHAYRLWALLALEAWGRRFGPSRG
jgi:asparagine synthase (glutamine-hydrolysing)